MTVEQSELINDCIRAQLGTYQWCKHFEFLTFGPDIDKKIRDLLQTFEDYNLERGKTVQWVEKEIDKMGLYETWRAGENG